jgi:hypothetical protein
VNVEVLLHAPVDPLQEANKLVGTVARLTLAHDHAALANVAHVDRDDLHSNRRRHGLNCRPLANPAGDGGIAYHGRSRHARRDRLEQFQPLPSRGVFVQGETGGIAAASR